MVKKFLIGLILKERRYGMGISKAGSWTWWCRCAGGHYLPDGLEGKIVYREAVIRAAQGRPGDKSQTYPSLDGTHFVAQGKERPLAHQSSPYWNNTESFSSPLTPYISRLLRPTAIAEGGSLCFRV